MRWFHRKITGHPTRYELECTEYNTIQSYLSRRDTAEFIFGRPRIDWRPLI